MSSSLASSTRSSARRGRRRRKRLTIAVVSVGTLLVLLGGIVGGAAILLHEVVGKNLTTLPDDRAFPAEEGRPAPSATGAQNILLLGSDSRLEGSRHEITGPGDQRSDVMMLVHVPADRKSIQVMSIMRDFWLPVPGHGSAKVNGALAWGGTPLSVQTVEQFLGARIDHVAIIDFGGISDMTTALGGVTVDNTAPFTRKDEYLPSEHFYAEGPITLKGPEALAYVRERKAFPTGDYQRVRNQQALLKGILDRAISRDVLGDPRQLADFATVVSKNLTVDAGFSLPVAGSLAFSLRGIDADDIRFFTVPTAGTAMIDGQSVVKVDQPATDRLKRALRDDTVDRLAASLQGAED